MNEESPQLMNESLKDESFIGANNSTGKKHYESNFMLYKFESPLHKSTNLTTSLKGLLTSRKDIEKKYSNAYFKVEKLKKEYEQEIGKINGLRKQSLSLYKFKKYADEWNQQRKIFEEKTKKEQNFNKTNSMKKKLMQEILISQTKSHLIQSKQQNVRDMKAQKNELSKLYIRNIEVENRKHINSRQKVLVKQIINKKSKKELEEKKILELNRDINKKIEDNEKKKQSRIKNIEKLQKDELEILKKIRNCHQIHELALNEYSDLKTQSIINYEKKYRKPIKLEPIKTNIK